MSVLVRYGCVSFVVLAVWIALGSQLHRQLVLQGNDRQLNEIANLAMQRVERSIDFVVIAGTELLIEGHTTCSDSAALLLRRLALRTSTVADVFMVTGDQICSSFDETSVALPPEEVRQTWNIARNPNYRIGSMSEDGRAVLGVSFGLHSDVELVSAINADALLFDVLPSELRSRGRIQLSSAGQRVAFLQSDTGATQDFSNWTEFSAEGERYPVHIQIEVDPAFLSAWHQTVPSPLAMSWIALGIFGAVGLSHLANRRHDHAYDELNKAIKFRHITPFFQPIVDTRTGAAIGCEALARWIKPNGELVPPGRFIPMVEDRGLNGKLLEVMFAQADEALAEYLAAHPDFYVSFNITPRELIQKGFVAELMRMVERSSFTAEQMCLEITERQLLASPETAAEVTRDLKRRGFRLAIDDAGTGHNGLAALQKLDVSTVKIDKYFIDHIDDDPRSRVMVDMFVSVARRYNMTTVAEGVETENQLAVLRATGVHSLQGYLISQPLPAAKFMALLNEEWGTVQAEDKSVPVSTLIPFPARPDADATSRSEDQNTDEAARLEALYRLQILDSEEEEVFDRIPRMIRQALAVPMAAIALIDEDRRWFKAVSGGKRGEIARQDSFCNVTIQNAAPTVVTDTLQDDHFRDNILVQDAPHIRAYLGVPLTTSDGYRIGSVCCVDKEPRRFSTEDIQLVADMSSIVMEQMEMRTLALFDPLTSARTRRGFCSEAKHQLEHARLTGKPFALMMLDIDHFKSVNDKYGHAAGDQILSEVGFRISECIPNGALFGRMGGEEFAVAMPEVAMADALETAEDIRFAIANAPFQTKWGDLAVTVSVGFAQADGLTHGLEELLEQADWALYRAKANGRNLVMSCDQNAA